MAPSAHSIPTPLPWQENDVLLPNHERRLICYAVGENISDRPYALIELIGYRDGSWRWQVDVYPGLPWGDVFGGPWRYFTLGSALTALAAGWPAIVDEIPPSSPSLSFFGRLSDAFQEAGEAS